MCGNEFCFIKNKYSLLIWIFLIILFGCGEKHRVYRIGILCGLDFFCDTVDGFKEKMNELEYIENKNIFYDLRQSKSDMKKAKEILQNFVADKVDLIFVLPTDVSVAAKEATQGTNIPVIFANANIEGQDLIKSIREPGDNITGVRYPGPDLTVKRFEIMHQLVSKAKRMWVPYKRGLAIVPSQLEALRPVAAKAGVILIETPADDIKEIESILYGTGHAKNIIAKIDAILMIAEPLVVTPNTFLIMSKYAFNHKIPIGGALMSVEGYNSIFGVSTNNIAVGRQTALLADKIFKNIKAGSIPVVSAESYFQINYKAAQQIGIKIPGGLLKQANEIIH
jgi:putative ABC transport system substrate-binding protein